MEHPNNSEVIERLRSMEANMERLFIAGRDNPPELTTSRLIMDLTQRLDDHIHGEKAWRDEFTASEKAWREELSTKLSPFFEISTTSTSVRKFFIWISGFIIAITGTVFGIKTIISWLK